MIHFREDDSPRVHQLKAKIFRLDKADRIFSRIVTVIVVLVVVFVGSAYYDALKFTNEGINTVKFHDFAELLRINPDTVAWLTMDGTHIDHPVVQGKDNFEYLDKNFYGKTYAGGTLFLDAGCSKTFSRHYQIIHGHHMEGGAMFGDLPKYHDSKFFQKNKTGQLLTPTKNYDLLVVGTGTADAYDGEIYSPESSANLSMIRSKCSRWRDVKWKSSDKVLLLSTCSSNMDNTRTVVFCRMRARKGDDA